MIDFSILWNNILPFVGRIFGLVSWAGTITLGDFLSIIDRLWVPNEVIYFTNLITGAVESIGTTGFSNFFFAPFILYAQTTALVAKGVFALLNISYSTPFWVVCSVHLLFLLLFLGLLRGVAGLVLKLA